jgi:hypothetical protein
MFDNINLKDELQKAKDSKHNIVDLFNNQISKDQNQEKRIFKDLAECTSYEHLAKLKVYDSKNVYEIEDIKTIAIKFRLRFLPTKYFKNEIPNEAIFKIKSLEKVNNTKIKQFYILAPSQNFDLEDINKDPLLFAPLNNGKYLLIHKWGTDLKWYKKLTSAPLKSIDSIFITIGVIALLIAGTTPTWLILNGAEVDMGYFGYHRMAWLIYSFILLCSLTTFICFSQNIYPSEYQWNKKTYN